ncbi:MAG: EscU/YscU/HrcU family type III secretion system export apparatus switch protein [bacterium]|nr:EscU/YscU/HrcU family type III secretion system export apparatus switch protein [bacterium]
MAQDSVPEERTELPTSKRMGQLRKDGSIHLSNDLVIVVSMFAAFTALSSMWGWMSNTMQIVMIRSFKMISNSEQLTFDDLHKGMIKLLVLIGPQILIMALVVAIVSSLAVMLQTKWNIKEKKIDLNFLKLNPLTGFSRMFSVNTWMTTGKSILKLAIILPIGYYALKKFAPDMVMLIHTSIFELFRYTGEAMSYLFWKIFYVLIGFAVIDYFWGKYQWLKINKMTKDEVKDEKKAADGDEQTKMTIQRKGLQRMAKRIRDSVPLADVIVTNPTHYAVALKYDRATMIAPMVVAKGKGFIALKIREIAKEHRIPILERKPLARALYGTAEVGQTIPHELFRAVAEVIAYVFKLKNPHAATQQAKQV